MKGAIIMRGDEVRYAMSHADPELAKAIWKELMTPKPSKDPILKAEVDKLKLRIIQAERKNAG